MNKKKGIFLIIMICAAVCSSVLLVMVLLRINEDEQGNMITRAEVAKMTAALFSDTSELPAGDGSQEWYDKYIRFLSEQGYMDDKPGLEGFSYGDLTYMLKAMGVSLDDIPGTESIVRRKRSKLSPEQWYVVYNYLIQYYQAPVICLDLTVIGTPANVKGMAEWTALTDGGYYGFEGIALDYHVDSVIRVLVRGQEIVANLSTVSTDVTYRNVWITNGLNGQLDVYMYGIHRDFFVEGLNEELKDVMADLVLSGQQISQLNLKRDTVRGKVLSISDSYVEIEGYGKVPYDEEYRVYKLYGGFSEAAYTDILVGYDMQEFIVADGTVCGITIAYPFEVENIRVLIKTNGFEDIHHQQISVSSSGGIRVLNVADNIVLYEAAAKEVLEFTPDSDYLLNGRIRLEAIGDDAQLSVTSLKRGAGIPEYPGFLEIGLDESGLYLINDVNLEEYLKLVVPAEMPSSYGVEALKVQAVCARSYAYIQLLRNSYREYGAHIDDSTSFQVYNNAGRTKNADEAVDATSGKVIRHKGNVIEAFYYSTSCGHGTNVDIWDEGSGEYGYLTAHTINSERKEIDLTTNDAFYNYIAKRNLNDYDVSFPYYRWRANVSIDEVNEYYGPKANVGTIKSMSIDRRLAGGVAVSLTIHGTEGDYTVEGEYEIRKFLGNYEIYWRNDLESLFQMNYLPSAYIALVERSYGAKVTGYEIIGGGYGHGVGMSQNAAYKMTQRGMDYEKIIHFFYDEVTLDNLYE